VRNLKDARLAFARERLEFQQEKERARNGAPSTRALADIRESRPDGATPLSALSSVGPQPAQSENAPSLAKSRDPVAPKPSALKAAAPQTAILTDPCRARNPVAFGTQPSASAKIAGTDPIVRESLEAERPYRSPAFNHPTDCEASIEELAVAL